MVIVKMQFLFVCHLFALWLHFCCHLFVKIESQILKVFSESFNSIVDVAV